MHPTNKTARVAGALYLLNGVTGFFSLMYVPSTLIVSGDATATAKNILAHETLFRLGIVSELFCAAEFIFWSGLCICYSTGWTRGMRR
jgi:Domain of unknown function (DUF4386)